MRLTRDEKEMLRALARWNKPDDVDLVPGQVGYAVKIGYGPCRNSELLPMLDALVAKGKAEKRDGKYFAV